MGRRSLNVIETMVELSSKVDHMNVSILRDKCQHRYDMLLLTRIYVYISVNERNPIRRQLGRVVMALASGY